MGMAQGSKATVIVAIGANFAIAAAKLLAGTVGKSSAMMSEAVHSSIDGVNDLLLLFGLKRSRRPADEQHPFGYGMELYFWSLIVAGSVVAIGGGVTMVEGVHRLLEPKLVRHATWAFVALACGSVFDMASLVYGMRRFRRQNRGKRFWEAVRESKTQAR